jgi:diaminopimelate decarboxylase
MRGAWAQVFDGRVEIAYSYKTNALAAVTRCLQRLGSGAEVVCGAELEWALADGHAPERIYFDGPVKRPEEVARAIELGVRVQLDSLDEVSSVARAAARGASSKPRVSVRLAVPNPKSGISRFGMLPEEFDAARRALRGERIDIDGVHVHAGNRNASPATFAELSRRAAPSLRLLQRSQERVVLDLGGGFPAAASADGDPSQADHSFALSVRQTLLAEGVDLARLAIVLEPGRALTEAFGVLVARVAARKQRGQASLLVLDAGGNLAASSASRPGSVTIWGEGSGAATHHVFGCNCFESDLIASDVACPEPVKLGTPVFIAGCGAYELSSAPGWIRPLPAVLGQTSGAISVLRRADDAVSRRRREPEGER